MREGNRPPGSPASPPTGGRSVMGLVFLTVFLDIVGFSILFPLFPAMLEHYLALEGAAGPDGASFLTRLVGRLEGWAGPERLAVATLFGGVLGSLYSLLQFLFAPVWGGLSDRIGRRPTLLLTLAGTLASTVLWIFAGSFALLLLSRALGGIMAGNISTASAVAADATRERERAGGMGIVGMAIGLGFILGPAIGGFSYGLPLAEREVWSSGLALNPFSSCALAASVLAAANLLLVALRLPETLRRGGPSGPGDPGSATARPFRPGRALASVAAEGVPRTALVYFLFLLAFAAMEFTLTFLAAERLGYTPRENAWMFVYIGLLIALVQGGLVRRLAPRAGERRLVSAGLLLLLPGFLIVGVAHSSGTLYAGLAFLALGSALAMPCLTALASRYAPAERQGLVLGALRSLGSLARAVGPLLGGLAFWRLGSGSPYLGGAALLLVPLVLSLRLPPPPEPPAGEPPDR